MHVTQTVSINRAKSRESRGDGDCDSSLLRFVRGGDGVRCDMYGVASEGDLCSLRVKVLLIAIEVVNVSPDVAQEYIACRL